jgi:hypothetical protein
MGIDSKFGALHRESADILLRVMSSKKGSKRGRTLGLAVIGGVFNPFQLGSIERVPPDRKLSRNPDRGSNISAAISVHPNGAKKI